MIRVFEAFSGYQSQSMALKRYHGDFECVGTSEIDEAAILTAAAAIHGQDRELVYPPVDKMLEVLISCNIGLDFKTGKLPWTSMLATYRKTKYMSKKNLERVKEISRACVLTKNYGDISKINCLILPDMDLFTYSFPCQDISMAGKQRGFKEESGSRSSLLWECEKIIELKRPKYLMMENVKALVSKKFMPDFQEWLNLLDSLGYNNYWKVINAKHCGVPQNRERVFCVSILKDYDNFNFHFYDDFDSGIRLKDVLEDKVDEKYYLSDDKVKGLIKSLEANGYNGYNGYKRNYECDGNSYCIDASYAKGTSAGDVGKGRRTHVVERVMMTERRTEEAKKIRRESMKDGKDFSPRRGKELVPRTDDMSNCLTATQTKEHLLLESGISNCLTTVQKDTMILVKEATTKGHKEAYEGDSINLEQPNSKTRRGRVGNQCAQTLMTSCNQAVVEQNFRIRKLTPRECFRLMGVSEEDINKIQATGISNSQQYKLAGNSIVVDCMKFLEQLK